MFIISLISILPIAIVNKLFSEESRLHLSQIYATKVTRSQLYWTSIGLSIVGGLLGVLLASGSLGGTAISVMGDSGEMDIVDFLRSEERRVGECCDSCMGMCVVRARRA